MNVSVIIPALNEAGCIGDLVAATLVQPVHEVVVLDHPPAGYLRNHLIHHKILPRPLVYSYHVCS